MATSELVRNWLGKDADTPAGKAWGAVVLADYDTLKTTLERYGDEATGAAQGPLGHPVTALTAAAVRGDTRAATMLLDAGADPTEKAGGHMVATPTAWSIEADSLGCVKLIGAALEKTDAKQPDDEDWCDLAIVHHDYIAHPDPEILRELLRTGARATQQALCRSVSQGNRPAAELLLEHGADPNGRDGKLGDTPLGWCVATLGGTTGNNDSSGPAMLALLLEHKADPKVWSGAPGLYQRPLLVAALEAGARWAFGALIDAGADGNETRTHIRRWGLRSKREKATIEALRDFI